MRYLMCPPTYFAVDYAINPWMDPSAPVDVDRAVAQWTALYDTHRALGHTVDLIDPVAGLPDMVFAANGAIVVDDNVLGVQFRHPERAAEAPAYLSWFERAGFEVHEAKYVNEGEGDVRLAGDVFLAGTGFRTEHAAHLQVQELFGRPVVTLQLVDPRFYHLDTALCVLDVGQPGPDVGQPGEPGLGGAAGRPGPVVAYYPGAFSAGSQRVLRRLFPDAVIASEADARVLGLNAVSDGRRVVLPIQATGLATELALRGYEPVPVDLSELRKAGGGPKCCTLEVVRR
jgi:N-dimethylarginine dimethylaminohydrolase